MTTSPVPDYSGSSCRPLRADAERNRLRIIAAARELFAERGLDVSLDDVAEAAGVGVGTVYRRFANRDDLVFGVFVEHLRAVAVRVDQALDDPDPWESMAQMMTWVCQVMAEDRGLATIIMSIDHSSPEIDGIKSVMTERVTRLFQRAMDAAVVRPDLEVNDFLNMFTMLSAIAEVTQSAAPGTWRRYLNLLLDALRAEPTRSDLGAPAPTDEQMRKIRHHRAPPTQR